MSEEQIGFDIQIIYGPLRLKMAEWLGMEPGDMTMEDVRRYEAVHGEERG